MLLLKIVATGKGQYGGDVMCLIQCNNRVG